MYWALALRENANLIVWMKERVASFKYPRHVEFITVMPMTATGKVLKKELSK